MVTIRGVQPMNNLVVMLCEPSTCPPAACWRSVCDTMTVMMRMEMMTMMSLPQLRQNG